MNYKYWSILQKEINHCLPIHSVGVATSALWMSHLLIFLAYIPPTLAQTLPDYQKQAAEKHQGLQAAYKEFEAALQQVPQVGSLADPSISLGFFLSPVETRVGPQRLRLSLSQMFPWFGTLTAQKQVASLMAEAKYQAFLDMRNQVYYQVALAYYPLLELQKLKDIEEENLRILDSYKNIAQSKVANGKGALTDVLRVDMLINESKTNLSVLEQKEKSLHARFNTLLNQPINSAIELADSVNILQVPQNTYGDSLFAGHPLQEALRLQLEATKAREQAVIKQGMPKIGLGLDYVVVGKRTDMAVPDNGKNILMPMATISLPIFRAKYKAAQKETQLQQEALALKQEDLTNKLLGKSYKIRFEIQQQQEYISLYEKQVALLEQSLPLLLTAYANSGKAFEEVLRLQQQLLKYQKMKTTTLTACQLALAELSYVMGEG